MKYYESSENSVKETCILSPRPELQWGLMVFLRGEKPGPIGVPIHKRESPGALAEVEYLIDRQGKVFPIEVKSGHGSTLRSIHQFLQHTQMHHRVYVFGLKGDTNMDNIQSFPLYAVAFLAHADQEETIKSLY